MIEDSLAEVRSRVHAGTEKEKFLFLRHKDLALTFRNGKLRLAGAKRPGVFRVPLEEVKEIHWLPNGCQVDFQVEDEKYHISFQSLQFRRVLIKKSFLLWFGAPGALLIFLLLYPRRKEICGFNLQEADKWRDILREGHANN